MKKIPEKYKKPNRFLVQCIKKLNLKPPGEVLDIGCGYGGDSLYLANMGFSVKSLDAGCSLIKHIVEQKNPNIEISCCRMEEFEFPEEHYSLVNAQYSLPFIGPKTFPRIMVDTVGSLCKQGVFCGVLFGTRHAWNYDFNRAMSFQSEKDIKNLLGNMRIISLQEREYELENFLGEMNLWHVWKVIAIK